MYTPNSSASNEVNEAVVAYIADLSGGYTASMGVVDSLADLLTNRLLVIHSIRHGISVQLFENICLLTPYDDEDWADYLGISTKTLRRYRSDTDHLFKPQHSEKILELVEVMMLGAEVFDHEQQFFDWLRTASYALGGMTPFELVKDSYGKELVMDEMHRIEHGVFA